MGSGGSRCWVRFKNFLPRRGHYENTNSQCQFFSSRNTGLIREFLAQYARNCSKSKTRKGLKIALAIDNQQFSGHGVKICGQIHHADSWSLFAGPILPLTLSSNFVGLWMEPALMTWDMFRVFRMLVSGFPLMITKSPDFFFSIDPWSLSIFSALAPLMVAIFSVSLGGIPDRTMTSISR